MKFFQDNKKIYAVFDDIFGEIEKRVQEEEWITRKNKNIKIAINVGITPLLALEGIKNDLKRKLAERRKELNLKMEDETRNPQCLDLEYKIIDIELCLTPTGKI